MKKTKSTPRATPRRCAVSTGSAESLPTADDLIAVLERYGLGWSLDHTGNLIEARIWDWPNVIGRYRPHTVEPLRDMLAKAMTGVKFESRTAKWAPSSLPNAADVVTAPQTPQQRGR